MRHTFTSAVACSARTCKYSRKRKCLYHPDPQSPGGLRSQGKTNSCSFVGPYMLCGLIAQSTCCSRCWRAFEFVRPDQLLAGWQITGMGWFERPSRDLHRPCLRAFPSWRPFSQIIQRRQVPSRLWREGFTANLLGSSRPWSSSLPYELSDFFMRFLSAQLFLLSTLPASMLQPLAPHLRTCQRALAQHQQWARCLAMTPAPRRWLPGESRIWLNLLRDS